ncbi:aminoglycoside phosphotransferase family protein [Bacillus suaedaesalsae]|uniref:Aminoglycoside phosphotransferase family protein n=1 Tax=Bacillus suaedaesalsae TaxID=2810349 RepID=A0ABS2DLS1_9BACI|nr:aminoglycoside phosphotransferase family protein [Bacillus suaedaesalsae]MBM6619431.1 aminoglycoside phosphotransferase family protein [Bacillus suaedaesalsae]
MHEFQTFLLDKYKIQDIVQIHKGFSNDEKYKVSLKDGTVLLVRVSSPDSYKRKKDEFDVLATVYRLGVTCSEPLHFHVLPSGNICMVLGFIEGEDGEEALRKHSEDIQYKMGFEAGRQLKMMHSIPAPVDLQNWYEQKWKKHMSYYESYKTCGFVFEHAEDIQRFIEKNVDLLKNRPSTFQHDDFHPGNLIFHKGRYNGVIDFNRYDWGDPYHDFYKVGLFTTHVSVPFAVGQLHGYFDNSVPDEFWKIYTVYMGMSIFSSILWSLKQEPSLLNSMIGNLHQILKDHNQFTSHIPSWYVDCDNIDSL